MKKIYKIEILKTEDGQNFEIYANGNRMDSFTEGRILAVLNESVEKVIGKTIKER